MTDIVDIISTNTAQITHIESNIVELKLLNTSNAFDLEEAKAQRIAVQSLTKTEKYFIIVDTRKASVQPTKEAQKYLVSLNTRYAEAIVVNGLAYKLLAKFYFSRIHAHPTKVFTNYDKAYQWIKNQKLEIDKKAVG